MITIRITNGNYDQPGPGRDIRVILVSPEPLGLCMASLADCCQSTLPDGDCPAIGHLSQDTVLLLVNILLILLNTNQGDLAPLTNGFWK